MKKNHKFHLFLLIIMIFYHRYQNTNEIEMNLVADVMSFYLMNGYIYFEFHSYIVELDQLDKGTIIHWARNWSINQIYLNN